MSHDRRVPVSYLAWRTVEIQGFRLIVIPSLTTAVSASPGSGFIFQTAVALYFCLKAAIRMANTASPIGVLVMTVISCFGVHIYQDV